MCGKSARRGLWGGRTGNRRPYPDTRLAIVAIYNLTSLTKVGYRVTHLAHSPAAKLMGVIRLEKRGEGGKYRRFWAAFPSKVAQPKKPSRSAGEGVFGPVR